MAILLEALIVAMSKEKVVVVMLFSVHCRLDRAVLSLCIIWAQCRKLA